MESLLFMHDFCYILLRVPYPKKPYKYSTSQCLKLTLSRVALILKSKDLTNLNLAHHSAALDSLHRKVISRFGIMFY